MRPMVRERGPTGTVTFVFTDIEGSTAAWEAHHAEMDVALAQHDRIVSTVVADHDGYVFSTGGDGVAVAFSSPRSALAAAVDLQRSIGATAWPAPLALRVRIGIHSGEAVERDGDYFGPTVIRAARLMALADGGRTVCSATTAALVDRGLPAGTRLVPVGRVRLKGLSGEDEVFAVAGDGLDERGERLAASTARLRPPPVPLDRLVGRSAELHEIGEACQPGAVVTLHGMGGIGKTRLAQEAASAIAGRFAEGVAWADLSAAPDALAARYEIATALGVRAQSGDDVESGVRSVLASQSLLLVLDNCEHVRQEVASLLTATAGGAVAAVLATSRERLGLPSERVLVLGPLDTVDEEAARSLLLERLGPGEHDPTAIARIVSLVDGIPLAIELAAARARALGTAAVAERLSEGSRVLSDRQRPDERHRALHTVLAWSHASLGPTDQQVFRRLAVFASPFPVAAAERVAGAGLALDDVDDALASLADRSLVLRHQDGFRLLEPVRQFAAGLLDEAGEAAATRSRHLAEVLDRLEGIHDGLFGPDEAAAVAALDRIWPDVRTAVRWAIDTDDAEAAGRLATRLAYEGFYRRPEVFPWVCDIADRFADRPGVDRRALLGAASYAAWTTLDVERAVVLAEEAMRDADTLGVSYDMLAEAGAMGAYNFSGRLQDAVDVGRATVRRAGGSLTPSQYVTVVGSTLVTEVLLGRTDVASEVDSLLGAQSGASPTAMGMVHWVGAIAHALAGDAERAALYAERARELARSVRNEWLLGMCTIGGFAGGSASAQLRASVDAVDELLRAGWATHAWNLAWPLARQIAHLGGTELAATWLGACTVSGIPDTVATLEGQALPAELAEAVEGHGDPHLTAAVLHGRTIAYAELRARTYAFVDQQTDDDT